MMQPGICVQAHADLDPRLPLMGFQTWLDYGIHHIGPIKRHQKRYSGLGIGLMQQLHGQGGFGLEPLAVGPLALATPQPDGLQQIRPWPDWHQVPQTCLLVRCSSVSSTATG